MNFSKTKPDLIESTHDAVVPEATNTKINQPTFSENICGSLQSFYDNYFKRYAFFLILIIIGILFLLYRYYKNKEIKRQKEIMQKKLSFAESTDLPLNSQQDQMTRHIYELLKENKNTPSKKANYRN